jgi:hypothetical protein
MDTQNLPTEIANFKKHINELILAFNNRVGLEISEVHVAPLTAKELDGTQKLISYDVAVGIDL